MNNIERATIIMYINVLFGVFLRQCMYDRVKHNNYYWPLMELDYANVQ